MKDFWNSVWDLLVHSKCQIKWTSGPRYKISAPKISDSKWRLKGGEIDFWKPKFPVGNFPVVKSFLPLPFSKQIQSTLTENVVNLI